MSDMNELTKREFFAALAMQGLLAAESPDWHSDNANSRAEEAVTNADALLAALAKEPTA